MSAIAAGAFGLLLGCLVGMSMSPVVSTVVTAICGLLAAVLAVRFGRGEGGAAPKEGATLGALRAANIAGFAIACLVGAFTGVYLRTHRSLGPSVASLQAKWKDRGFDDKELKRLIVMEYFNPEAVTVVESRANGDPTPKPPTVPPGLPAVGVGLFTNPVDFCGKWNDEGLSEDDVAKILKEAKKTTPRVSGSAGDAQGFPWSAIGPRQIENLAETKRTEAMKSVIKTACFLHNLREGT